MIKEGIIDPAKVTKGAVSNSVSVSAQLLATEAVVFEEEKEEKEPAGAGMGDDMMM